MLAFINQSKNFLAIFLKFDRPSSNSRQSLKLLGNFRWYMLLLLLPSRARKLVFIFLFLFFGMMGKFSTILRIVINSSPRRIDNRCRRCSHKCLLLATRWNWEGIFPLISFNGAKFAAKLRLSILVSKLRSSWCQLNIMFVLFSRLSHCLC